MLLVKVSAVLSLLVAGSYGRSQSDRQSTGQDEALGYDDKPVHFFSESKYRLDKVPCYFTAIPPDNKVNHYSTFVYRFSYYTYRCIAYKLQTQKLEPGNQGVESYNLRSPGFDSSTSTSYPSRRLSYYHIKCKKGTGLHFRVMEFALQDKIRVGYNERKCVDYVSFLDLNNRNYEECCGTHTAGQKLNRKTYGNDVLVTFRTSRYNNHYKGFLISAICNVGISSMENCLKVEETEYTTDKRTKIVPKYALTELRTFLRSREQGEDGVWMMSDDEAVWNTDILSLAVLSERSCDAEYKRAGKAVLDLFPQWMVKKEREDYMKDAELYV